jgi:PmbA protein
MSVTEASTSNLTAIADRIVGRAQPGEQIEVIAMHSRDTEIRVYDGAVESFAAAESQGVGVRIIADGRQGFAYAGTFDEAVLLETLSEARDNAAFGTFDEHLGLAEFDGVEPASLGLYDPALLDFATDAKIDLALELDRATRAGDPRILGVESAEYVDGVQEYAIVSTAGIRATGRETGCYLSVSSLAEQDGDTQTGYGWSVARRPSDLDVARASSDAVERATRLLGAVKPTTDRLTVVLTPFVTAQLLGILGATFSGEAVLKGRSLFADRLGDNVAPAWFTLVDDPTVIDAYTASEVDGEGLATRRNVLIGEGVVHSFLHNAYTARRAMTRSTGSAVRGGYASTPGVGAQALRLLPGTATQAELIAKVDRGLLVQDVSGLHSGVNPVSGDFSTGAEGLMIRSGALAEPVRELTIASTLQKMLHDAVAVGGDQEWLPMNAAGVTLVVDDVTMSGA